MTMKGRIGILHLRCPLTRGHPHEPAMMKRAHLRGPGPVVDKEQNLGRQNWQKKTMDGIGWSKKTNASAGSSRKIQGME